MTTETNTIGMLREPTPEFWAACGAGGQGWPGEGPQTMGATTFRPNPLNVAAGIRCVPGRRGEFETMAAA
jgi:hypothetical protein